MSKDEFRGADRQGDDFVSRASDVFARDVFQPMYAQANHAPSEVRDLIAEFRHKLDALDIVVSTILGAADGDPGPHPALRAALDRPVDPDRGVVRNRDAVTASADSDGDAFDDVGRNQRSRLRELTLLDFMSRESRAYSLQQVLNALQAKGFDDSSGAIVSQLHRLKKLGVIDQPAGGMYEITTEGLSHLHKLRASFGSLLDAGRG